MIRSFVHTLVFIGILSIMGTSAEAAFKRIAILGDSITHDGRWATLVESALRDTPEYADSEIVNFGLPSETVSGLSEKGHAGGAFPRPDLHERLTRILDAFHPELILACYGMNDGIYLPLDAERMKAYQSGVSKLAEAARRTHAEIIFITPPLHQADKPSSNPDRYDLVLDKQAEWLVSKRTSGWKIIDIRPELKQAVASAKQLNPAFVYASDDIHPGDDGHRFIATSVSRQIWTLLKLRNVPRFAGGKALSILKQRNDLLKHAWLTKTRHIRPGIPDGLPVDQAETNAKSMLEQYRKATTPKTSVWSGYEQLNFTIAGRSAWIVKPKTAAPGNPWIWRTEFFGHEPQADLALLEKGFHVTYIDVQNLYGAPVALQAMAEFHDFLTHQLRLSTKPVMEGMSRGGLFAFNWAAARPEHVAGLYVDAPVCDIKSWPGGKGKGPGSPEDWKRLLQVYGFTEEQALAYDKNPVDNLAPIAKAGIPILAVIGEADEVVPVEENINLIETRYQKLGGSIHVIRKPGCKHHPHSLPDPEPIVEFAIKASRR